MADIFTSGQMVTYVSRGRERETATVTVEVVTTQVNGWVVVVGEDRTRTFAIAPSALKLA